MLDLLIITGASKGIGASIVDKCSTICKTMIVLASSEKINNIVSSNCKIIPIRADLSDYTYCYYVLYNTIYNSQDTINSIGFVLCGGQIGEPGGLLESNLNDWDKLYRCNLLGNLAVIKACSKIIKSGAKTKVVFFGGGGAAFAYPDFSGYALSKVATVRAAENLSLEFSNAGYDASIIAIAPGAVATDILDKVMANGGNIRTKTDISEPTNFVYKFLNDEFNTECLNGRFLHVRDNLEKIDFNNEDMCKLRRIS